MAVQIEDIRGWATTNSPVETWNICQLTEIVVGKFSEKIHSLEPRKQWMSDFMESLNLALSRP